jgi:hypothetical protein
MKKRLVLLAMLTAAGVLAAPEANFSVLAYAADVWVSNCRVVKGGTKVGAQGGVVSKVWFSRKDWTQDKDFTLDPRVAEQLLAVVLTAVASNRQVDILVDGAFPDQVNGVYIRN